MAARKLSPAQAVRLAAEERHRLFLKAEVTETIGTQKGERLEGRSGYRSVLPARLIT
jgi:hypothetical protein